MVFSSDKDLVSALVAGEEEAWLFLPDAVENYLGNPRIRRYFSDYSLEFKDLVSEAYVYLTEYDCKRLKVFRFEQAFSSYMYSVFRACQKRLLAKPTKKRSIEVSGEELLKTQYNQTDESPEQRLSRMDMRDALNEAFALLWRSNSQRANIYLLREKLEMPSKEVAELLGMSVGNVDALLSRTKNELQVILRNMHYEPRELLNKA